MLVQGVVKTAELVQNSPASGRTEMVLSVQGPRADQPRRLVIPHEYLAGRTDLDPLQIPGRSFRATVQLRGPRFEVTQIDFTSGLSMRIQER